MEANGIEGDIMLNKKLRVLDSNILYFTTAILFWTAGAYFQGKSFKGGLIITQYIIILLPPVLYAVLGGFNIKEIFRLNKISLKHGFLIACITILVYPLAAFGNALMMAIMSIFGNLNIPQIPTATNSSEYLIFIFIISISAGICEEIFFRGFMLSGYERMGKRRAIIFSAVLFGIFHFNLYNLIATTILGLVFGYLVVETNSIFAGVIGHMVNNGFAVTLGFILNLTVNHLPDMEVASEMAAEIPTSLAMVYSTLVFGVLAIITSILAYQLVKIIKKDCRDLNQDKEYENNGETGVKAVEFLPLILPIVLFIITSIIQIKEIISLG